MTPTRNGVPSRLGQPVVPLFGQVVVQGSQQCVVHGVVMTLGDTVFAVITAQLRKERDGLVRPLLDQLAEQPRQRVTEGRALVGHVGREEIAGGDVGGEPAGVEAVDQVVRAAVGVDGGAQNRQRIAIVESHAA
jgi:hypothetical protein